MMDWLFGGSAWWFSVPAILGTAYFAVSLVLGELGGDLDADVDVGDAGEGAGAEFRVLSLQTISAFAMGSGWMGLAAMRFMDFGVGGASVVAVLSGVGVAWVLIWLLRSLMRLQASDNIALGETLGAAGTVYVTVPPAGGGSGRVILVVNRRQREFNAVQRGDTPIASKTRVRVMETDRASNTVTVEVV